MTEKSISLKLSADTILVKKSVSSRRIIEIALKAPELTTSIERSPVNLALVIDRSGSMSGGKLEDAKKAAIHIVGLLKDTDHISVVLFDDSVDVLVSSVPATPDNKREIIHTISRVHTGGSTHLSGGWLAGCQQIANTMRPGEINRCLLLTDGQANVGITDTAELAMHSRQIHMRGIATSCFGLGLGFNERLLEAMANEGGGKFYYISQANEIPAILALELGELTAMVATGVQVYLELPSGATAEVPVGWRTEIAGSQLIIYGGDLYSDQEIEYYVRLTIPPFTAMDEVTLPVSVTVQGGIAKNKVYGQISFRYADDAEVDATEVNLELMQRYARVDVAEAASEALRMERMGKGIQGGAILEQRMIQNAPFLTKDDSSTYSDMTRRIQHGMDEADRKASHEQQYRDRKRFNR